MTAPAMAPATAGSPGAPAELQVVVFELGEERYGLAIETVHEIIRHTPATAVPQAPSFVDGVINLRGIAKVDDGLVILLDLDALLGDADATAIAVATS